ncbi:zinc-ribbon domain-containing protein [Desulfatirhabdium butyrativorans]|uniref:zinc-ribbon domain-containing protein n=1 Tax=Desulfatirhabdium butyrativorans TaxID=340467 RepID=UPI00146F9FB1|nr:zinc-ribbon domain-containing protein [Desulfatirhabdium butyrativorans]
MEIICSQCQAHFRIAEEKLPESQAVVLTCPKCKNRIQIDRRQRPAAQPEPSRDMAAHEDEDSYDAADRPFDYIAPGARTAMICETDDDIRSSLSAELMALGYYPVMPVNCEEALKRMRFHVFNVVIVNDRFDCNQTAAHPVLETIRNLAMETRRAMFVVLLSDRFRTMDDMAAFHQSVNLIINDRNIAEFTKIFNRSLADHQLFYEVFLECQSKLGKS